ncbi:type VI secretion system contractile sheath large subunit, partial [Enterobacter hormaechei]|nr:type VI secretion system contractile sheath large subunit [Enterobacter hormaechei]
MSQHEEHSIATASGATTTLLDEIMSQTRMTPENDGYYIAKQGVAAFIGSILDT